MPLTGRPISAGCRPGLDTVQAVTREWCDRASDGGWAWLARYLPRSKDRYENPVPGGDFLGCWSLSRSEYNEIAASKLIGLAPIQWAPIHGTPISGGANAARNMVNYALWLGIAHGCHLWCDLEGSWAREAGRAGCEQYVSEWARAITDGGYRAGLYVGQDVPMSGSQLYALPRVTAYWCSATLNARMTEPAPRGYSIRQGYGVSSPIVVCGVECDPDVATLDLRGGSWYLAA